MSEYKKICPPCAGTGKIDTAGGTPRSLLELARQAQAARDKTAKLFPRNIFRDSAWDLMLELFVGAQERRSICVKELVLVSGETSTSALRRIDSLEEAGLLRRCHDSKDHRRVAVVLTPKGEESMSAMLSHLFLGDD
ncbi:winged helix DNA-binding protein [Sphingomonas sp. PB2P19]|uniref:winged helix DNA-binding protein n=1 Tax=Sphingomonas rhamnosi TaxID=3096156 RepID=UPI002FC9B58A